MVRGDVGEFYIKLKVSNVKLESNTISFKIIYWSNCGRFQKNPYFKQASKLLVNISRNFVFQESVSWKI